MQFTESSVSGVWRISLDRRLDDRGFFARAFCEKEFGDHGLPSHYPQCNISFNRYRGALRGMHFQRPPMPETKIVRCIQGAIYDVVLDLRAASPTYLQWTSFELSSENRDAVYIPEGCAHGFQTLTDNAELYYHMGSLYAPEYNDGVRWNDPAFGIVWPESDAPLLSEKDRNYPDFKVSPWAQ